METFNIKKPRNNRIYYKGDKINSNIIRVYPTRGLTFIERIMYEQEYLEKMRKDHIYVINNNNML